MRKALPPFTMLVAFEAAARLLSFTKAAQELNVSQPAVSRHVRELERRLGLKLFKRGHRSVALTAAGQSLSKAMSQSLSDITAALANLTRDEEEEELVIAALPAFATLWLAPRLQGFCALNPLLKVRLISQESPVNLNHGGVDIALRFGEGSWPDGEATLLFHDEVFPVCSGSYIERHGRPDSVDALNGHRLIAYDQVEPDWLSWREWLADCFYRGPPIPIQARYSNYPDAILAALDGQGIVLGWQALVDPYIRAGRLVRLGKSYVTTRSAHFAVVARNSSANPYADKFIRWMRASLLSARQGSEAGPNLV